VRNKAGVPVSDAADVSLEIGVNFFPSKDEGEGTAMCPLKAGYRYTLNGTGEGFYVEPQVGYNIYGATSVLDDKGDNVDLKFKISRGSIGSRCRLPVFNQEHPV
jgi:hypothetical protein